VGDGPGVGGIQVQVEHCKTRGGMQPRRQQRTGSSGTAMGLALTTVSPTRAAASAAKDMKFMVSWGARIAGWLKRHRLVWKLNEKAGC
jgi:hypothetical protein